MNLQYILPPRLAVSLTKGDYRGVRISASSYRTGITYFVMLAGEYFLNHVEIEFAYDTALSRLLSLKHKSSLARFKANCVLLIY